MSENAQQSLRIIKQMVVENYSQHIDVFYTSDHIDVLKNMIAFLIQPDDVLHYQSPVVRTNISLRR